MSSGQKSCASASAIPGGETHEARACQQKPLTAVAVRDEAHPERRKSGAHERRGHYDADFQGVVSEQRQVKRQQQAYETIGERAHRSCGKQQAGVRQRSGREQ